MGDERLSRQYALPQHFSIQKAKAKEQMSRSPSYGDTNRIDHQNTNSRTNSVAHLDNLDYNFIKNKTSKKNLAEKTAANSSYRELNI